MRCIAANRSILTAIDQNMTLPDHDETNYTAMTNDIDSRDTIQFADGWYSYPDLNTFDSDLLLDVLTIRNIKLTKIISPWNVKAENSTALPLTEIATRQLEALFNLSQLLFGLARSEQSNYTFRDLQLGHPLRSFRDQLTFFQSFNFLLMIYLNPDPRLRCVKQKSIDFLTNISIISEIARSILDQHSQFLIQLIQGIRDGHLIEEKIPSLSLLLRLSKVIIEKNLLNSYQHLIDMQLIDILIDIFQNEQYKSNDYMIYFIKFESFALQCLHMILQCVEHVDMWSEKAQIRLVNYCCTILYKSVLDNNHHSQRMTMNHIIYAEEHEINHSLNFGILTFLNIVRCRKEIERFYRENEHFRELISIMKHKYTTQKKIFSRDPSIANALNQIVNIMFDRYQKKKRKYLIQNEENRQYRKCSNSLCQMIENDQIQFEDCPHCHQLLYCSQYCREVHWTLNHNLSCRSIKSNTNKEELTNKTTSMSYNSAFETLTIQITQPVIETTAEITNNLYYPSSSSSTSKKKSFKTLLSLLRVSGKRR